MYRISNLSKHLENRDKIQVNTSLILYACYKLQFVISVVVKRKSLWYFLNYVHCMYVQYYDKKPNSYQTETQI